MHLTDRKNNDYFGVMNHAHQVEQARMGTGGADPRARCVCRYKLYPHVDCNLNEISKCKWSL